MSPAAAVRVVDGQLVVVIAGGYGRLLDALLTRALSAAYATGGDVASLAPAHEIAKVCARAAALASFGAVPLAVREMAVVDSEPARWVSVIDAAGYLRVTPRAVRARIARGTLPARRVGRDWLVRINDEGDAA